MGIRGTPIVVQSFMYERNTAHRLGEDQMKVLAAIDGIIDSIEIAQAMVDLGGGSDGSGHGEDTDGRGGVIRKSETI